MRRFPSQSNGSKGSWLASKMSNTLYQTLEVWNFKLAIQIESHHLDNHKLGIIRWEKHYKLPMVTHFWKCNFQYIVGGSLQGQRAQFYTRWCKKNTQVSPFLSLIEDALFHLYQCHIVYYIAYPNWCVLLFGVM
jgi:hypothetical protein